MAMVGSSSLLSSATNTLQVVFQLQNSSLSRLIVPKSINNYTRRLVRFRPQSQVSHTYSGGKIGAASAYPDDDDIYSLLQILPHDVRGNLLYYSKLDQLLEVTLDLGRLPRARYYGDSGGRYLRNLRNTVVSMDELEYAESLIGEWGGDNRAGIEGTLHRISVIRNKNGKVVGLTCRVGRPLREEMEMVRDLLEYGKSILFLGRPGVGKTTVMQGISRVLSEELLKRVVIVDTSNEIGGDGDIPHPAIGTPRRLQVPEPCLQHKVMIEAVENHMPEVIIVDEIGTEAEVHACRTIAQRGVMLIGSAHGKKLEDVKNPTHSI